MIRRSSARLAKAFLTKAGEKPKGGLSKMAKPKLRELVDAVLAGSQ